MGVTRWFSVARETSDGAVEPVSAQTISFTQAQEKRHRIVQNTHDTRYFVAFADVPDPDWKRA